MPYYQILVTGTDLSQHLYYIVSPTDHAAAKEIFNSICAEELAQPGHSYEATLLSKTPSKG